MSTSAKHLSLEILRRDDLLRTEYPQKISDVYFYKVTKDTHDLIPIWSIASQDKSGLQITQIVYGKVPTGFIAMTKPQPISPGDTVYISFSLEDQGIPSSLGDIEVTVSE